MIDPFFQYFINERSTLSQEFYNDTYIPPKRYERFLQVKLPKQEKLSGLLEDALHHRVSSEQFSEQPISLETVSTLLGKSVGRLYDNALPSKEPRRPHPSGGAKYPIEIYPFIVNGENVNEGMYHYNIADHTLEYLIQEDKGEILKCFSPYYTLVQKAGIVLILSFLKGRSMPKYGNFSYKVGLIEGGHVGQNIYLVSTVLGLGCRALGGGDSKKLNRLFRLDGVNESVFYALAIGVAE